jgi:hypothetical protein
MDGVLLYQILLKELCACKKILIITRIITKRKKIQHNDPIAIR